MANDNNSMHWVCVMGMALAITLSWAKNASILWAILHGICAWFYVIYYAIFC